MGFEKEKVGGKDVRWKEKRELERKRKDLTIGGHQLVADRRSC